MDTEESRIQKGWTLHLNKLVSNHLYQILRFKNIRNQETKPVGNSSGNNFVKPVDKNEFKTQQSRALNGQKHGISEVHSLTRDNVGSLQLTKEKYQNEICLEERQWRNKQKFRPGKQLTISWPSSTYNSHKCRMNWRGRSEARGPYFVWPEEHQGGAQRALTLLVYSLRPSRTILGRHHCTFN